MIGVLVKMVVCGVSWFMFRDNDKYLMTLWVQSAHFVLKGFLISMKKVLRERFVLKIWIWNFNFETLNLLRFQSFLKPKFEIVKSIFFSFSTVFTVVNFELQWYLLWNSPTYLQFYVNEVKFIYFSLIFVWNIYYNVWPFGICLVYFMT